MIYLLTFVIVLVWSYCQNRVAKYVIKGKKWRVIPFSIVAGCLEKAERFIVIVPAVLENDLTLAIPSILADTLGDHLSSYRAKKKPFKVKELVNI